MLDHNTKLVVRTLLPLLMIFLMSVPVLWLEWPYFVRFLQGFLQQPSSSTQADRQTTDRDSDSQDHVGKAEWKRKLQAASALKETKNICWNNVLTWLFLVFPSTTLTSMQAFSCRKIGDAWYLTTDLRHE